MTTENVPIGLDSTKLPGSLDQGPHWTIDRTVELGLDGVFFRSVFELSRTLDLAEMREVADHARERGLISRPASPRSTRSPAPSHRRSVCWARVTTRPDY